MKILKYLLIILLFAKCENKKPVEKENNVVKKWIANSKKDEYSKKEQLSFLRKAYKGSKKTIDSTKAKTLSLIAYRYYQLKDSVQFLKINQEALDLAMKINDLYTIADTNWSFADLYYDLGNYPKSFKYLKKSYSFFNSIPKKRESAMVQRDMGRIKKIYRDYSGSEVLYFKAIKNFKELNANRQLYHSYNNLASLQNEIKEYDRALAYHKIALDYLDKIEDQRNYKCWSYNNMAMAYLNKKDDDNALLFFKKALESEKNKGRIASINNNIAEIRINKKDTNGVKKILFESLKIKQNLKLKIEIIESKQSISKYYAYSQDTLKALKFLNEANSLAKEIKNSSFYLKTLNLLSIYDKKNSSKYLEKYIKFNDSLITVERKTQNKFTRIEFETEEFKEETARLSKQQIYISTISILAFIIFGFIYFLKIQKNKNEKLLLEAEQQKATEEVYLLTLQQQAKLEAEKAEERNRISQELHDGILGKLFGTRVGLGFLDISDDDETQEQHQSFLNELQAIEKEIRDVSHKLHSNFSNSEVNFTTIVQQLLKEKSTIGNFKHKLIIDKNVSWNKISELVKVHIYRIIQESLQNIVKHAKAKNVSIFFTQKNGTLQLEVNDDGVGFDSSKKKKGIGLKNIQSRIQKLHGELNILSSKKNGTSLKIKFPID
jgi:signal transduction histidine kinase